MKIVVAHEDVGAHVANPTARLTRSEQHRPRNTTRPCRCHTADGTWTGGEPMSARRPVVAGVALVAVGLLGACSRSFPARATGQGTGASPARSTPDHSSCSRSTIRVSVRLRGGAASQIRTIIVLTNQGRTACTIEGYPRIEAVGQERAGPPRALPLSVTDGSNYFAADPGPRPLTLAPGAAASSTMETFLAYVGATARTTTLTIRPPGPGPAGVTVPYQIALTRPAGHAYPLTVTAWVAGSNGPAN